MKILSRGLLVAACASALASTPALAADVTVRVEGSDGTLLAEKAVTTPAGAFRKNGGPECQGNSAAGALEVATNGNWSGAVDNGTNQRVEVILGESHAFFSGAYWGVYLNDAASGSSNCDPVLQNGDEVVFAPGCEGSDTSRCFAEGPLDFTAPRTVRPGEAFDVTLEEATTTFANEPPYAATTTRGPSQGATVAGGGASATTGADGRARLSLGQRGEVTLVASKGERVREGRTVCVTDGADGFCGTTAPGQPAGSSTASGGGAPASFAAPDRTSPTALIQGVRDGQVFSRSRAPRVLRGQVGEAVPGARALRPDTSGILMVKLRLTRADRGRCSTYSGSRERFVRRPCGAAKGYWFKIGDRATWEYLLPSRLPRGRYVLDVNAVDRAYNRDDARKRGVNRVVFRVR